MGFPVLSTSFPGANRYHLHRILDDSWKQKQPCRPCYGTESLLCQAQTVSPEVVLTCICKLGNSTGCSTCPTWSIYNRWILRGRSGCYGGIRIRKVREQHSYSCNFSWVHILLYKGAPLRSSHLLRHLKSHFVSMVGHRSSQILLPFMFLEGSYN